MAGYDIMGVRKKARFDEYNQNPYAAGLTTPGLMDSPDSQQPENPFGGLFKPPSFNIGMSPETPPTPDTPKEKEESPMEEYIRLMKELYHPATTASDRLNSLISSFPQEKRPSLGRTLVGAAAGLGGGIKASQEIMDEPFKGDLEKWKAQTTPAYQAAEVERQRNDAERTLTGNVIQAQISERKNKIAEEKSRAEITSKEKIASEKARISEMRSKAAWLKANDYVITKEGDSIMARKPGTTERINLGPSGGMDRVDELEMINEGKVKAAEALGTSRANIAERQQHPDITIGGVLNVWDTDTQSYVEKMPGPEGAPVNRIGPPLRPAGTGAAGKPNLNAPRLGRNDVLREAHDDPETREFVMAPAGASGDYQLKDPPNYGPFGIFDRAGSTKKIKAYNKILDKLGLPPLPVDEDTPAPQQAPSRSATTTTIPPSPSATKGLGPQAVPPATATGGYKYQANQSNPREQRRTKDGRTYEYSHDGGQTWGAR